MLKKAFSFSFVSFFVASTFAAQPLPPRSSPPPYTAPTQEEATPPFVMTAPTTREESEEESSMRKGGYYFGAWAGANAVQDGTWLINGAKIRDRSVPWWGGGIKFGYTWPFSDDPVTLSFEDGQFRVSGALEAEAFGVGSRLRPRVNGVKRKLDIDSAVFMLNFLIKGQTGRFQPYVGPGIGFAALFAHGYDMPARTDSSDEDISFAFQVLAGCDYFLYKEWSIFGEYRFLSFPEAELFNSPTDFEMESLNQHLFSLGLRHHF